jgi:hypothetical protein
MKKPSRIRAASFIACIFLSVGAAWAQGSGGTETPIAKTFDPGNATAVLASRCASCHDWAVSYDAILASGILIRRRDSYPFQDLLIAHAGIGIAIPVIILGAGAIMDPTVKL